MTLRTQAARGLKWQVIEIAGRQVLSLALFATLARLLDPSAFGLVGLVGVYLALIGMFVDQGIGAALVQRKNLDAGHLDVAFWFSLFCAAVLCAGTMLSAGHVASFFREPALGPLLRVGSIALIINATATVHSALFMRAMDFRRPAIRTFVANVFGGAVGVGMALNEWGVWALVGQQVAAAVAGAAFIWQASTWRPRFRAPLSSLRELTGVSLSIFAVDVLWSFSSRFDQVVIGRLLGAAPLGQYVVGAKLSDMASRMINHPLMLVSIPALSSLQDQPERMRSALYQGMNLNAVVSLAVFGGLGAVAPTLGPLAFGEQWRPAVPLMQLWCIHAAVLALFIYCYPALLATGRTAGYVILNILTLICTVVACAVGVRFGPAAILLGLIFVQLQTGLCYLVLLRRHIGLSPRHYLKPAIVPTLATTIMAVVVAATRSYLDGIDAILSLAIQVSVGVMSYVGMVALMDHARLHQLYQTFLAAFLRRDKLDTGTAVGLG